MAERCDANDAPRRTGDHVGQILFSSTPSADRRGRPAFDPCACREVRTAEVKARRRRLQLHRRHAEIVHTPSTPERPGLGRPGAVDSPVNSSTRSPTTQGVRPRFAARPGRDPIRSVRRPALEDQGACGRQDRQCSPRTGRPATASASNDFRRHHRFVLRCVDGVNPKLRQRARVVVCVRIVLELGDEPFVVPDVQ